MERPNSGVNKPHEGISLNISGKSRNPIGFHQADSMKEGYSDKFSISNIPKSTTNKTYSSLTQKESETPVSHSTSNS